MLHKNMNDDLVAESELVSLLPWGGANRSGDRPTLLRCGGDVLVELFMTPLFIQPN
jgi:hypothetical protein